MVNTHGESEIVVAATTFFQVVGILCMIVVLWCGVYMLLMLGPINFSISNFVACLVGEYGFATTAHLSFRMAKTYA